MTRYQQSQPENARWRNLLAVLVAGAVLGVLYLQFNQPAGDSDEPSVNVARLAGGTPVESSSVNPTQPGAALASISDDPQTTGVRVDNSVLNGRLALLMNLLLIERGHARLAAVPDYSATFFKQERVGRQLGEAQVMKIKLRHAPLSIYMKWLTVDKGRELLYVDGQNSGKMLVHAGGWKARLLPTIKLDPEGSRAMKESRHPVTKVGLLEVARRSIEYRKRDLEAASGVHCRMLDNQQFDDRPCYCFIIEYDRPELSTGYRKVVAYVDKQLSLPVSVKNYGWPKENAKPASPAELDEQTLLETYSYSGIELNQKLTNADFDRRNKSYKFR